ncbi:MAG: AfsR/SARP family transcriptional regulator [Pseudonocardiaceae bacterium]
MHEARRLGNLGREALESNAIEATAALFRQALDLWRGPALVDVQAGPILRLRLTGIEEFRLTMLEQRIEADLRLGRHHELLSELSQLAGEHPPAREPARAIHGRSLPLGTTRLGARGLPPDSPGAQ